MTALLKGLLLGAIQIALVLSLGGKLLYDRIIRPRVWVLSEVYDPEMPIRGRYLSQRLRMRAVGLKYTPSAEGSNRNGYRSYGNRSWAHLEIRNGELIAQPQGSDSGEWVLLRENADGTITAVSEEPVVLFIPENAKAPVLKRGEELWIEVTVPRKGPPRPIQIGIRRDGVLIPLGLR